MTHHCCEKMTSQVDDWQCGIHADRYDCADALIDFTAKFQEYGLIIHDGGSLYTASCPASTRHLTRTKVRVLNQ